MLVRYLLGEVSEEEQERTEQLYLSDPNFYEQLLIAEDDLIDAYAEGALPESRRASFEEHFLRSPERRARVGFATAWMTYVTKEARTVNTESKDSSQRFFSLFRFDRWPIALRVAAVALLLVGIAFPIVAALRLRNQLDRARAERAELERNQNDLRQQIEEERRRSEEISSRLESALAVQDPQIAPPIANAGFVSFVLTPGLVRGSSQSKRLEIRPEERQVRIHLVFTPKDALNFAGLQGRYTVKIKTVDGRTIWTKSMLSAQTKTNGKVLTVSIPSDVLHTEDYILTLSGETLQGVTEIVSEYFFSVFKK